MKCSFSTPRDNGGPSLNNGRRYKSLPFVPDVKADLTDHVLGLGLEGIFHYLAKEEAIRKDPLKRTTEILQQVFGS